MSFVFPTNASQVQAFAGALYGVQVGTTTMAQVNADIAANGGLAATLNSYFTATFGGATTASVATTVATNLGLTGDALTSGAAYVEAQLNASAAGARGAVISNIVNLFGSLSADATFGAAATAWNTKVAAAASYTGAANVAVGTVVSSSTTFVLTPGTDAGVAFTGTSNSDTFDATGYFNAPTGTVLQTLSSNDFLDGGEGTDTLNVALNTATATTRPGALTNIEVINLTNTVGTNILDLATASGVTTLNSVNSATQIAQFNNVQSAPTAFGLKNTGVGLTANILNTALAGTTDAATLTIDNVSAGTVTLQTLTAASGYETLNIVSAGVTANVLTAVTDGISTSLTTINVSGTPAIDLGSTLDATVTTVDATNLVGALTVVQTNAVKTTITGGAGNDIIDVSGAFVDLTDATNADVINGGAGTDTLILSAAEGAAVTAAAQWANVTSIETVRFDTEHAAAINGTYFTGVTTFEFRSTLANGLSHTLASGQEIQYDVADNGTDTQTFTITGVGTSDSMTIDINGVDIGAGTQTYVGIETLNIATSGTALIDGAHVMTPTAATETINISGSGTLTLGDITADAINNTMSSGTLNLGTLQQATSFTSGASVDTVIGSSGSDLFSLGAGNDVVTQSAGNDIYTLGTGEDDFIIAAVAATGTNQKKDIVTDFTVGTDDFDLNLGLVDGAGATAVAADYLDVSGGATTATFTGNTSVAVFEFSNANDYLGAGVAGIFDASTATGAELEAAVIQQLATDVAVAQVGADTEHLIFVMYDEAGNAVIVNYTDSGTATADLVAAADFFEFVVLTGVAPGTLTAADFI